MFSYIKALIHKYFLSKHLNLAEYYRKKYSSSYAISETQYLVFDIEKMSFNPREDEIIFIDPGNNTRISRYVRKSYSIINDFIELHGYHYSYLPKINKNIFNKDDFIYLYPYYYDVKLPDHQRVLTYRDLMKGYDRDATELKNHIELECCFIRFKFKSEDGKRYVFSYFPVSSASSRREFLQMMYVYSSFIRPDGFTFYSLGKKSPDNPLCFADSQFEKETQKLVKEIKEKVDRLRILGCSELIIKELIKGVPKFTPLILSDVVFTEEYRIFLPRYNNMEIIMTPLVKAVYILFYRHSDKGIIFKNLPDYLEELYEIYSGISNRESPEAMCKSIEDVVNPTKNSINEKCTRIKEAFLDKMSDRVAFMYYISGAPGGTKMVKQAYLKNMTLMARDSCSNPGETFDREMKELYSWL